jgi:hypothetical protein
MSEQHLTAAELLRRKAGLEATSTGVLVKPRSSSLDLIDEEIRRLEDELQNSTDDDNISSSDSSDEEDAPSPSDVCFNLSQLKDDRIEPLPESCLPKLTSKQRLADNDGSRPAKKQKSNAKDPNTSVTIDPEIRQSVQAMLQQYVPRSSEKLPFYCRFCQHQYSNEAEFKAHQTESEFHRAAVLAERKATYCKLCQKQMTSPTQMQEHLRSGPHKERLEYRKQTQQQRNGGGGRGGAGADGPVAGRRGGRGGRGYHTRPGSDGHSGRSGNFNRFQSNDRGHDTRQWK